MMERQRRSSNFDQMGMRFRRKINDVKHVKDILGGWGGNCERFTEIMFFLSCFLFFVIPRCFLYQK